MTSRREIIDQLSACGVPEGEADVYFQLSQLNQAKAAEVARATGRRRPDIYPLLERLVERGFVQRTTTRPTHYIPLDVKMCMERLLEQEKHRLVRLERDAGALVAAWPKTRHDVPLPEERLAVHQGVDQIVSILKERLAEARHTVQVAMTPGLVQRLDGLVGAIHATGCDVSILSPIDSVDDLTCWREAMDGCKLRHLRLPSHLELVLIDGREAFLFLSAGRGDSTHGLEEQALWLRAIDAALCHQAIFDHLWAESTDIHARIREIRGRETPVRTRVLRGSHLRRSQAVTSIEAAIDRVQVFADAEEMRTWEETGLADVLRARVDAGLDVSVHSRGAQIDGVPTFDLPAAPGAFLLVVDRREALCATPGRTPAEEHTLWTTQPRMVDLFLDALDPRIHALV